MYNEDEIEEKVVQSLTRNRLNYSVLTSIQLFDDDDNIIKAHIVKFSWSADHRVLDGATVARFSNRMKDYLEDPASMVMDLR